MFTVFTYIHIRSLTFLERIVRSLAFARSPLLALVIGKVPWDPYMHVTEALVRL